MNRRILVTAVGGDVGHSILKCLNNQGDILFGCDKDPFSVGMDCVVEFFVVPQAGSDDYIEALLEICRKCAITHLIPVSEPEIAVVSHIQSQLAQLGCAAIINSNSILDICLDKMKTMHFLRNNNIVVPDYYSPEEFTEDGRQYIVKMSQSCGSKLVKTFYTQKELSKYTEGVFAPVIVQEYIPATDDEYTIGVFRTQDGETRSIAFKRQLQGGFTKFVELVLDNSISKMAELVAEALNLHGSINIQMRRWQGKDYIFEINPRLSGTVHFRHLLGFCDTLWWLNDMDKIPVGPFDLQYSQAIGIREMNEKFLILR